MVYLAVALGGALGAVLRWALGDAFPDGAGFPWTTFVINVTGSLVLAWLPAIGAVRRRQVLAAALGPGVLGGATVVLYGLVGVLGVRIWLTIHVDFSKPLNQMTAAIPLIIGIADFTWHAGDLTFTGIALGSIAALLVYHGMRLLGSSRELIPQRGT